MKFTTTGTPESFSPPPKPKHSFLSQPHQPFFFFGMVWAIVSMVLFTLSHKGTLTLTLPENLFHMYSLTFIVIIQFFHGFLFTTYPRFCMSEPIANEAYIPIVFLYQFAAFLFFVGSITSSILLFIAISTLFIGHILAFLLFISIYRNGKSPYKSDPFWFLIAHTAGVIAHILIAITLFSTSRGSPIDLIFIINPLAINLFLVFLTFIAAQRMIPFFSHSQEVRSENFVIKVFTLLLIKTFFTLFDLSFADAGISILLALYLLREFLRWKLPLFQVSAILWILYLALFWLPTALLIGGVLKILEEVFSLNFLVAETHLLMLGFLTTVLIGFGTRVTLGHSGQTPHANNLTIAIFWWTQIVVFSRFALSADTAFGATHQWLFDIASGGLILLFTAWSLLYGKTLVFGKKL